MANILTFANTIITDAELYGGVSYICDLNAGEEFSIGNTASASVSFVTDVQLPLYTKDSTNGTFTWTQDNVARGRFYITEVTKHEGFYNVMAYDGMILLETNISALALPLPLSVAEAAYAIAEYIGCTVSGTLNNGTIVIRELDPDMTARALLGYIAEASGCSVKINAAGELCFVYYADSGISVDASAYISLEAADYVCAAIDNVTIINSVGDVQASAGAGTNTLFVVQNPLLEDATDAQAQTILSQVDGFVYAPFTCEMFEENGIEVGTIATFGPVTTLVMHIESGEDGAVASSIGSDSRAAYNKDLDVASMAALALANRNISLSIDTAYTDTDIVFTAQLMQNGEYITIGADPYPAEDFSWYRKMPTGIEPLGAGVTLTLAKASISYGETVYCTWSRRQAGRFIDNAGNTLITANSEALAFRAEY